MAARPWRAPDGGAPVRASPVARRSRRSLISHLLQELGRQGLGVAVLLGFGFGFGHVHQEVDIASAQDVIRSRTGQHHSRLRAENIGRGAVDDGADVRRQAHERGGVIVQNSCEARA